MLVQLSALANDRISVSKFQATKVLTKEEFLTA